MWKISWPPQNHGRSLLYIRSYAWGMTGCCAGRSWRSASVPPASPMRSHGGMGRPAIQPGSVVRKSLLLTRRSPRHSAPTSNPDVLGGGRGGGDVVEHATREGKDG